MTHRVPSCLRLALVIGLLAPCLLFSACGSSKKPLAPEPPAAATFRTFDHPSDDGQTINLEWGRCPGEAPDVFYVVEIASEDDLKAGRFLRVGRLPSLKALKSDEKRLHDYDSEKTNRENRDIHYLAVEPAKFYPADAKALGIKHYSFRLAVVRVEKKTEKRKKAAAPPQSAARPEKQKPAEEPKPILLVAKEDGAQLVAELAAFDGDLKKLGESFQSPKAPKIVEASYLPALSEIEDHDKATTTLRDKCAGSLRDLDRALRSGSRDLKQEVTDWQTRRAEAQRKAAGQAAPKAPEPKEEEVEVEVEVEGAPVYVTGGGAPKVVEGRPALPPLVRPDGALFHAFDLPSDDGATVAVQWPHSPSENGLTTYLVEIAEVEKGKAGAFKKAARAPSLGAEKSAQPRYFGFSPGNEKLHYVGVQPDRLFPPDEKAIRKAFVEEELRRMPASWMPDADFAKQVMELRAFVAKYLDGIRGIQAALDALDRPILPAWRELDKPFQAGLDRYGAYATPLQRFENHIAKRTTDAMTDKKREINRKPYAFRLAVQRDGVTLYVEDGGTPKEILASARPNYFKGYKLNNLLFSLGFCSIVFAFLQLARRNPNLFIRKIAGLEAVEEAIGRATEMGKSVFFVHGLGGMGDLATIAAVSILSRVARRSAEYDTRVRVMNNDPIVLAVSQEVVKQAYTEAGRPDAYNADDVALVASDQFSYAAAVNGRMVRERPATIFMMGSFAAESLLLAETGNSTGAIQIAGTDSYTQIPFFITSCDYTLIGEELYAASAYLSREPRMLGSLRGQDVGKAFLMLIIVLGSLALTLGKGLGCDWSIVQKLFKAF